MREPGKLADGMEMQAIVAPCPRAADRGVLLEHDGLDAAPGQRARGRQAGRTAADDDHRDVRCQLEIHCTYR